MELRGALELRKNQALTPYKVDAWEAFLLRCNLLVKYPNLTHSLRYGFDAGIRPIYSTYTPPNSPTLLQHPEAYQEMVSNEFKKGRYVGPCTRLEVEALIGPFQSSPLSWVPKPGKPGKYRAVHNFSFPHTSTSTVASINSTIDADTYPCTWGTFATICFTIYNLPPGSQASIRDVAEAYRTIPILPDQWPGLVVKLLDDDEFAINICDNFGLASAGGIYGEVGDATLDIFRVQGIGPISKWVDDHIFFCILSKSPIFCLSAFTNSFQECTVPRTTSDAKVGTTSSCSMVVATNQAAGFGTKGKACPTTRSPNSMKMQLAPSWITPPSPTALNLTPVTHTVMPTSITFLGSSAFPGSHRRPSRFRQRYLTLALIGIYQNVPWPSRRGRRSNIWKPSEPGCPGPLTTSKKRRNFTANCYMPASCSRPAGLILLTWKASWLPSTKTPLFLTMPPVTLPLTSPGGSTPSIHPDHPVPSQARLSSQTEMPSPTPAQVLASALLSATSGELGASSQVGRQTAGISDGLRPLASNFLLALSAQQASQARSSGSSETTKESLRGGGKEEVETGRPTRSSGASTTSQILTNAFLLHATSPVERTQPTLPPEDPTHRLIVSSQQSAYHLLSGNILLTSITSTPSEPNPFPNDPLAIPIHNLSLVTNRVRQRPPAASLPLSATTHGAPRPPKPSAYSPHLSPHPSPLRPHCLARDRLRLWKPSPAVCSRHSTADEGELEQIFEVMSNAWADSTRESYSSGILVYHVYCDMRGVPEELRAPASQSNLTSFIVSLAGSYSGSTISNYIYGIRAWHILHGLEWSLNALEMDAALRAAE